MATGVEPLIALLKKSVAGGLTVSEAMTLATDLSIAKTLFHMREAMNSLRKTIEFTQGIGNESELKTTPTVSSSPSPSISMEPSVIVIKDRTGKEVALDNSSEDKRILNSLIMQLCAEGITLDTISTHPEFQAFGYSPLERNIPEGIRKAMIVKLYSDINTIINQRLAEEDEKLAMDIEQASSSPSLGLAPQPGQSKNKDKEIRIILGLSPSPRF